MQQQAQVTERLADEIQPDAGHRAGQHAATERARPVAAQHQRDGHQHHGERHHRLCQLLPQSQLFLRHLLVTGPQIAHVKIQVDRRQGLRRYHQHAQLLGVQERVPVQLRQLLRARRRRLELLDHHVLEPPYAALLQTRALSVQIALQTPGGIKVIHRHIGRGAPAQHAPDVQETAPVARPEAAAKIHRHILGQRRGAHALGAHLQCRRHELGHQQHQQQQRQAGRQHHADQPPQRQAGGAHGQDLVAVREQAQRHQRAQQGDHRRGIQQAARQHHQHVQEGIGHPVGRPDVIELLDQLDEAEQRHEHQCHQQVALRHGAGDVTGKNHRWRRRRHCGSTISTASTRQASRGTSNTPGQGANSPFSTASITTASRL